MLRRPWVRPRLGSFFVGGYGCAVLLRGALVSPRRHRVDLLTVGLRGAGRVLGLAFSFGRTFPDADPVRQRVNLAGAKLFHAALLVIVTAVPVYAELHLVTDVMSLTPRALPRVFERPWLPLERLNLEPLVRFRQLRAALQPDPAGPFAVRGPLDHPCAVASFPRASFSGVRPIRQSLA